MPPILYSFRRCPYAIRARLALASAGIEVELREILLRDKHPHFLEASESGTVPCLVAGDETFDESLDIMKWALARRDPDGWLSMPESGWDWIARADGPFKQALDRTKYANRYQDVDPMEQRQLASAFLIDLDAQIDNWIFETPTIADFAILPFVRQFAFIDKGWFDSQPWPKLKNWLEAFLASERLAAVMDKIPVWQDGDQPTLFPMITK